MPFVILLVLICELRACGFCCIGRPEDVLNGAGPAPDCMMIVSVRTNGQGQIHSKGPELRSEPKMREARDSPPLLKLHARDARLRGAGMLEISETSKVVEVWWRDCRPLCL